MIDVVLVEDEPHARNKLKELIRDEPDLKVVGECTDGLEALRVIAALQPKLIFLDIEMPGLSGVELVKSLERAYLPYIIVTTAYSEHAVWAFDINVTDYLLKPYDTARFRRALHRVRAAMRNGADTKRSADSEREGPSDSVGMQGAGMLKLKVGTKIKFISPGKIRYIKAQGDRVLVNTVDEEFSMRARISAIAELLDTGYFLRVHRSALLNITCIKEMKPRLHGDYEFTMQDGAVFRSSASYREAVRAVLGKS
ncbi:MAG: LytR/AlgR family response regulator transcription factor [Gammaproteobacteria bacterium]